MLVVVILHVHSLVRGIWIQSYMIYHTNVVSNNMCIVGIKALGTVPSLPTNRCYRESVNSLTHLYTYTHIHNIQCGKSMNARLARTARRILRWDEMRWDEMRWDEMRCTSGTYCKAGIAGSLSVHHRRLCSDTGSSNLSANTLRNGGLLSVRKVNRLQFIQQKHTCVKHACVVFS